MANEILSFKETQRFRQWWIFLLLLIIVGSEVYTLVHFFNGINTSVAKVILFSLIKLAVIWLLLSAKLTTEIDKKAIRFCFFPFNLKQQSISWDQISRVYIREYNPILEYGGWGYRSGLFGKGKAVNVSGNIGLQLELKDGKRLLIGTNKREELSRIIFDLEKKLGVRIS